MQGDAAVFEGWDLDDGDLRALKSLLVDMPSWENELIQREGLNIFEILRVSRTEIRHSNMLAWLFNPRETHGLEASFLNSFISKAIIAKQRFSQEEEFGLLLHDFNECNVYREWCNTDILIESEPYVICIENKVGSGEHSNQLKRYRDSIMSEYPSDDGWKPITIYLSPHGECASDDTWIECGYTDVVEALKSAVSANNLNPTADFIIAQYIDLVERHIVGDTDFDNLCKRIYERHRRALDILFEHRPDFVADVSDVVAKWCEQQSDNSEGLIFDPKYSTKTYIRVHSENLNRAFPALECEDGWHSHSFWFYEFEIRDSDDGAKIRLKLTFNGSAGLPDSRRDSFARYMKALTGKEKKMKTWLTEPVSKNGGWKIISPDENVRDAVFDACNHQWGVMMRRELAALEKLGFDGSPIDAPRD